MSRIESVKQNYLRNSNFNQNQTKFSKKPSFSGELNPEELKDVISAVGKKIDTKTGWVGKFSKWLYDREGELQNQYINAAFTTTVAPIIIGFNPFSNEDKNSKKYTALRQPISAGVALTGGVLMTNWVNSYMGKMASEGYIKSVDLRMAPDGKNYLKYIFNKGYKVDDDAAIKDNRSFLAKYEPKDLDEEIAKNKFHGNSDRPTKAYKKACMDNYIKTKQTERKALFTSLISEDPKNIVIDETTKIISLKDSNKAIGKNIPNINTQKELDAYLETNNLHKVKFSKLMEEQFKFEFFKDGKLKPYTMNDQLSSIKGMEFLRKTGLIKAEEYNETELVKNLGEFRQEAITVKDFEDSFAPGALKPKGGEKAVGSLTKEGVRNTHLILGEEMGKKETSTLSQLFHRLGLKGEKLQDLMDKPIAEALNDLATIHLKGLKVTSKDFSGGKVVKELFKEKNLKSFATNIIDNKAARLASDFKNFNKYAGIAFNVPMVIITCTILNWVYPRAVALLFPSLLKESPKNGGNK